MTRALVTFATGAHLELLELALPRMADYAERHQYTLLTEQPGRIDRPVSWGKLPALHDALDRYDEALWVDADVLITDDSVDLADLVPAGRWQALVRHHTPDGEVPNTGVWLVRQPMQPILVELWGMTRYLNHPWWEQAALLDLLGYRHDSRPVEHTRQTELYHRTHWLGLEWNSHEQNDRHPQPRFAHATCGPLEWRLQVMRDHLERRTPVHA